ncbi:MAG: hypothetical protein WC723_05175 [Candidatus Omnitrophota bacterium]
MKKIFLVLIAAAFAGSVCFAQEPSKKADEKAQEPNTFKGTIESIAKVAHTRSIRPYCKIVVANDKGRSATFYITKNTAISDVDNKQLPGNLLSLETGRKVKVKYSNTAIGETITDGHSVSNNQNVASSVSYLE